MLPWSYSADGTPKAHKDSENDRRYVYDYDSLGRLVSQEITDASRENYIGFLEQSFDLRGNVNKLTYEFGGRSFSQIYSRSKSDLSNDSESYAKDNLPTVYKIASDKYVLYDYDSLNRLNQKTFYISDSKSLYYNYKFKLSERNGSNSELYRTSQVATEYIVDDVYGYNQSGDVLRLAPKWLKKPFKPYK